MDKTKGNEKLYYLFQKLGGQYPSKGTIFLPESEQVEELKKIFEVFFENGKISDAITTAKLLPEPHRTEAIIKLIDDCEWISDALNFVDILSEPQRTTELTKMFESYVGVLRFDAALQTANLFSDPQQTEAFTTIIEGYIKMAQFDKARKVADMILKKHQK